MMRVTTVLVLALAACGLLTVSAGEPAGAGGEPKDTASLSAVEQRMGAVAARLSDGDTSKDVRDAQRGIVTALDGLIAAMEKEQEGEGSAAAGQEGKGGKGALVPGAAAGTRPLRPAEESTVPGGQWSGQTPGGPGPIEEGWMAALPPTEREKVQQAFKAGRLPRRYQALIEQYSRALSAGEE